MGLFYLNASKQQLVESTDEGYLLDPYKAKSQTRYVFNCSGTIISWRFVK